MYIYTRTYHIYIPYIDFCSRDFFDAIFMLQNKRANAENTIWLREISGK